MTRYTLYGTESSFYTGKVRSYLDWKRIDYDEVPATLKIIKSLILPKVHRAIVPVMKMPDGEFVQDSSEIIATVEAHQSTSSAWPSGPLQKLTSLLIELFSDEWLIIPALHYRWNHNEEWTYQEFGRTSVPDESPQAQYEFGVKQAEFFKNWLPEVGVNEATIPGVEKSYEAFLDMLSAHFEDHDYLFGSRPSYADFSLYGPLYAHMYRDPESRKLMDRVAPAVSRWVERCQQGGGETGELLTNDIVPPTLLPILRYQMAEQLPVLLATSRLLDEWARNAASNQPLPRGFGTTAVTIGGCEGTCLGRSFPLFRLQGVLEFLRSLSTDDRQRAKVLLDSVGAAQLQDFQLGHRLKRSKSQLVLAP